MLANQLGYLGLSPFAIKNVNAQSFTPITNNQVDPYNNHDELGLIAILVESSLLSDGSLKNDIVRYAKNAQERIPHSKAFIMEVDKEESTLKISTVLEKLYYEGLDTDLLDDSILNNDLVIEDDNKLAGVIIIGDVPIPVVHDETIHPSIYPYTDFYRKMYIYNYETENFELNGDAESYNPEIWHGIIVPPSKDPSTGKQQLEDYFEKNNAYSEGDPDYTEFDKRMLYANFPEMEDQMNFMDYRNYERYGDYMEEMAFYRYNKHLLKELIGEVSTDMGSSDPIIPDETIDSMLDVTTDFLLEKYMTPLSTALKIYRGKLNDKIDESGRWTSSEIDTPDSLVSMRDEYAKFDLREKQMSLENEIDEVIEDEVSELDRAIEVTTGATLKVNLVIFDIDTDTTSFTFDSYVDGQRVLDITNVQDCGIYRGSKRSRGESVLENNSVLVKANRMYNPASLIEPPDDDDWELEEDEDYIDYAGCVFNNSVEVDTDEIELNPNFCKTEEAILSLFDIIGSREEEERIFEPGTCSIDFMSFHTGNDLDFAATAAGSDIIGKTMGEVINDVYSKLRNSGHITEIATTQRARASAVLRALIKNDLTVEYEPIIGADIRVWANEKTKDIDSLDKHTEPTSSTIATIKHIGEPRVINGELNFPQIVTHSIPSDGIRYIGLADNGERKEYEYPNIYRIEGENAGEIADNLISTIIDKEDELETLIGGTTNVISRFFYDNSEVIEPIIWNSLGTDQKLAEIIPKYLDRDSLMPAPNNSPPRYPQNKPSGYEVMHIVSNGDTWGYNFGLNSAMRPISDEALENAQAAAEESGDGDGEGEAGDEGGISDEGNYVCGDPKGVEIWEWFDALQCWIEEEIIPAAELFKLDESCGAALPEAEEEDEEDEGYVDLIEDTSGIPVQINAVMERKSLVIDQQEIIKLYPLNSEGNSVIGYIDTPVHLELSNLDIGEFDKNDFNIFTGEEQVIFTAKEIGTSQLYITMGDIELSPPLQINVYEYIDIAWSDQAFEDGAKTNFNINVKLFNPSGQRITDVNTDIVLSAQQPTDGGFEDGGRIQLIEGGGSIVFEPTPGPTEIVLIEKDQYITNNPYTIYPPPNQPVQLVIKSPSYIPVGEISEMEVAAVDIYGVTVLDFNESIELNINEESEEYASILNPNLTLSNGKGNVRIQANKHTGEILLTASHPDLKGGVSVLPILARVESDDWSSMYSQNLFASFVGFPAGNFFEENYFGGAHLFNGKTEAVYSFLTGPTPAPVISVEPNYKINLTQPQQKVYVGTLGSSILLQAFDLGSLKTLINKTIPLDFDDVIMWEQGMTPEQNNLYVELLDNNYKITETNSGIKISTIFDEVILDVRKDEISIPNPDYILEYNPEPEFNLIELILTDGFGNTARLMLNLEPESLDENNFDLIDGGYLVERTYSGNSTNAPSGIVLYEFGAEIEKEIRGEYYGLEGESNYIQLFASGSPVGEAVRYNLPSNGILLGDPTIQIKTKSSSGLNYDKSKGNKIYQDSRNAQIISINHFNFNNDGYEDVAMVMEDGRIRLLEGGATEPILQDRGDIAFFGDGTIAVEVFDFANDNYEDLLVATDEGRLAILHNDKEVITRTDQKIKVGKKLYTLLKGDMDKDGFEDLVTLDSRGDIRIFYNQNNVIPENGTLIGNYGFSLALGNNLYKDLDVRYPGLDPPTSSGGIDLSALPIPSLPTPGVEPSGSQTNAMQDFLDGNITNPSESKSNSLIDALREMAAAAREDPAAFAGGSAPPLLPWPEENSTATKSDDELETYFAPVEDTSFLNVSKTVYNKERPDEPNIDLDESLVYTIDIYSSSTVSNVVFADTVPDALTADLTTAICEGAGCANFETTQSGIRLFLSGITLYAGSTTRISYEATVAHTPRASVLIQQLTDPLSISDPYLDIMVSPPYNTTGDWIQHYTTGPRSYAIRSTSGDIAEPSDMEAALEESGDFIATLAAFGEEEYDEDNQPDFSTIEFPDAVGDALNEATGGDECFDVNPIDGQMQLGCSSQALDDIAGAINDFACMGGGCFPMPFNYTFMVPQEMPFPIFAFPTTQPTAVGPIPFIWPGSFIGASNISGPIVSMMRFYMGISLTGGMGIAMCWGPYMGSTTPPPPMAPIPYPPPIGNCMVTALPADKIWGGLCGKIEEGINQLMQWINSGINKINSAAASVNNNQNIPAEFTQTGGDNSAGGLEIGLAVNLGESMKFEPPAQGFSNLHIPAFDSLGGVISSWVDRQTMEIVNKLLTLPTFYIYLPDIKSLFSLDIEKTEKAAEIWVENMGRSPAVTGAALKEIKTNDEEGFLEGMDALEAQARIFNLNALEGIYDVASALPLVNISEYPIEFKVPWLSAAEIQAYIIELEQWKTHYEREFNRVKDKWEKLTCSAGDNETAGQTADEISECAAMKIAEAFTADFEPLLESVQENIEVLQSYLKFPRQFVKYKSQLADYVRGVACYLDTIAQMLGGWYGTIKEQVITWAELILTIIEIIKNIKELFDLFIDFDTSCSICTNERNANFGWWMLLGLILPEIPIISFPKWPDIVFDISNIDAAINVELPILRITPEPIPLPPLPYLRLPDFPTFDLLLSLPPLPVLPRLPEFPDLPELPPLPTVDLPTLPSPPKLPDIGKPFELIIPIIEQLLNIWCLMKKAFAPVPEASLNDQITLLTNRPAYLIPLDMLKLQLPNIAPFDLGFNEMRIDVTAYLGLRIQLVSKALESGAEQWNEWIEAIPEAMNEAYEEWLAAQETFVQSKIDEFEEKMAEGTQWLEDQYQEGLDEMTEDLAEAFEAADEYLRDKEDEWQDWADEQGLEIDYQDYVNAINDANGKIEDWGNDVTDKIDEFFDENINFSNLWNDFVELGNLLGKISEKYWNKPEVLEEVNKNVINASEKEELKIYLQACLSDEEQCFNGDAYLSYSEQQNIDYTLQTNLEKQFLGLLAELNVVVDEIKNAELVDFRKVKEDLGVPDYKLEPRINSEDKINWMRGELLAYSDQLDKEAEELKDVRDLYALAKVPPRSALQYELASVEYEPVIDNEERRVFSSAVIPTNSTNNIFAQLEEEKVELLETIERKAKAITGEAIDSDDGYCSGVCLPDPITDQPTEFIPVIYNPINSETLFLPSGHVVYSDGTALYLKRDLTIDTEDVNTGDSEILELSLNKTFLSRLGQYPDSMEAINMLKTTLVENGSVEFTWLPSTNPNAYGYGIELERSILGYDIDRYSNELPDTKFVLLPPDETGKVPEVLVDGEVIPYGVLITSIEDEEEAREHFGIEADEFRTGASQVTFTTINGATITLDENKAVYFDKYTGSSYGMNMVNGYYHIKMTWFSREGRVASYNQSELLAPQIYVDAAPPIDIAESDTYYVPIYKEKRINAGEIFVDLSDVYNYYWYVDVENNPLTPEIGDQLFISPQHEPKEFSVKLVATQNIEDELFEKYEKTFKVVVYVPKIELEPDPLGDGTVQGTLKHINEAPNDYLSNIPFSLFRKRWNTWKNLGLLIAKDGASTPPLNDHSDKPYVYPDSYYTITDEGEYVISGIDFTDPSPIILRDFEAEDIARVLPETGRIELLQEGYKIQPLSATPNLPTRVAVIEEETDLIAGNVYYVPDMNTDVETIEEDLNINNIFEIGTTVGDANLNDDIIAINIPGYAPSYPGGVAIFNQTPPQKNIALIDTDGSIRIMQSGYKLRIKNESNEGERYIFQIITENDDEIFDVYIHANFNNLAIQHGEVMDEQSTVIGLNEIERIFAQSDDQSDLQSEQLSDPPSENPFPDLDSSHPFYEEIINLYKARVISGYGDGTFKADEKLTRAEFIKIALGVTNCYDCTMATDAQKEKYKPFAPFPDVKLPAWYYYCVSIAKDLAMITGYGDGLFRPNRNISRAEAAAVLLRQSQIEIMEMPEGFFQDIPEYAWYKDYVYTAVMIGLIKNDFGFVHPDEEITRGEFAFMGTGVMNMYDCHEVDEDGDGMPDWWEVENNLDPLFAGDADDDNDGDGRDNLQEWLDGTDPNVADTPEEPAIEEGVCPCTDNPNQNDTDGDGLIDPCDDDLDGDSIPNTLCMFDDSGLVDDELAAGSVDNCIFDPNEDQLDSDFNYVGDICEPTDECPPIPEDYDGVLDGDGCPDIDDYFEDNPPGIYVNSGPACNFIDYESDFVEGDVIMTAITDITTHDVIFEGSNEATYQP
ncbi:S-layer homology domain-containing protein [Patescibacteria group bacterium]|nr:S-layer homology domain-containing protein [Patescibacteria group bacterium]